MPDASLLLGLVLGYLFHVGWRVDVTLGARSFYVGGE